MASPLIDRSHGWFRTWFRKVWKVRGGGLYACGFAVAFIIFEVGSLADDVLGVGAVFQGQAIEFAINFIVDSLLNTLRALMWPVYIIGWSPPYGIIGLGLAFWLFPTYVKPHIETWLFDEEPDEADEPEVSGGP